MVEATEIEVRPSKYFLPCILLRYRRTAFAGDRQGFRYYAASHSYDWFRGLDYLGFAAIIVIARRDARGNGGPALTIQRNTMANALRLVPDGTEVGPALSVALKPDSHFVVLARCRTGIDRRGASPARWRPVDDDAASDRKAHDRDAG